MNINGTPFGSFDSVNSNFMRQNLSTTVNKSQWWPQTTIDQSDCVCVLEYSNELLSLSRVIDVKDNWHGIVVLFCYAMFIYLFCFTPRQHNNNWSQMYINKSTTTWNGNEIIVSNEFRQKRTEWKVEKVFCDLINITRHTRTTQNSKRESLVLTFFFSKYEFINQQPLN